MVKVREWLHAQIPKWKACLSRTLRPSSPVVQGAALCLLTFCVVLPLACHKLLYSYYYWKSLYLDSMSQAALQESWERGQQALRHWQAAPENPTPGFVQQVGQGVSDGERGGLLITVVTARRQEQGLQYHYLLQVALQLQGLLEACPGCAEVLVCNVEGVPRDHEDAELLKKRFRVEEKHREYPPPDVPNLFEKEKQDYVYCLKRGLEVYQPRDVLMLEDDALPLESLLPALREIMSRRFYHGALYVKLYHPERLQRYWNPEPCRILEWLGAGGLGSSLLCLLLACARGMAPRLGLGFLFLTLYIMLVCELFGRHYLLELRRLSPQLLSVSPATECCTPAMLYPRAAVERVVGYLSEVTCRRGHAKDMALYRALRDRSWERAYSVEPNLVRHIGAFSSVRASHPQPRLL
ncbi:transmembrane protein 246 [Polyodon spathula]|uniref:transmembrane protein 246 n=1 Tax=Polyodon spathula TaxID=7913 RepID=UPI001B7F53E8|nr:transmembrane protein 246 [Polyodon spathula]